MKKLFIKLNINYKWFAASYPWLIWLLAASFFFYKYLIQVSPSVMTVDLMETFQLNGTGLGNLTAFYFYAYLLMQIPVGYMIDQYSPRLVTTCAIFICSLSTLLFSQANTLWLACVCRALMGVGSSFAAVSCFKLASQWFASQRFALISGMFMTAAMLGAVNGQMPLSVLVQSVGWREALEIISLAGVILGILYFMVVQDQTTTRSGLSHQNLQVSPGLRQTSSCEQRSSTQYCTGDFDGAALATRYNLPANNARNNYNLMPIITNKQTWLLSLYSGLAFAPVSVFGGLWGVSFLEVAYHLSRTNAALAISYIFIGFALGAPFWGWLSDFMGRRKPILFGGTFCALICLSFVIYSSSQSLATLMALLFFFGFGASGFFTSFAMIRELFPITLVATIIAIMNTFDSICEALYEPLIGAFLDWTWDGAVVNSVHQFSIHSYHFALILLPVSFILALITLFFINETSCCPKEQTDSHYF